MNDRDPLTPLSDDFIDRIVDGVLTPRELRDAIAILDRHPDGWKRCAVAFLEAQCWRESLKNEELSHPRSIAMVSVQARPKPRRWFNGSIVAASIAASFALGWLGHTWRPSAAPGPAAAPTQTELTQNAPVVDSLRPVSFRPARPTLDPSRLVPRQTVHEVARLVIGSEDAKAVVPILAGPGIDANWVKNQPPPVSEHERVALQRQGYQVDQRRRLITTTLPDGRRVTIPIDRVQIRYTGNPTL